MTTRYGRLMSARDIADALSDSEALERVRREAVTILMLSSAMFVGFVLFMLLL